MAPLFWLWMAPLLAPVNSSVTMSGTVIAVILLMGGTVIAVIEAVIGLTIDGWHRY